MGWAGGSFVANELWQGLKSLIPLEDQEEGARIIVDALKGNDWDTLEESPELMEAAYGPEWYENY